VASPLPHLLIFPLTVYSQCIIAELAKGRGAGGAEILTPIYVLTRSRTLIGRPARLNH